MVDLGRPANFAGSDGVLEITEVSAASIFGVASWQFTVLETPETPWLYRARFANFTGRVVGGGVGTVAVTFQGLTSGLIGPPWPAGGPLACTAPVELPASSSFSCTWNTEVADNYVGVNNNWGMTYTLGLPLLFLPGRTAFSIEFSGHGGWVGDVILDDGLLQIERFTPDRVAAGGTEGPLADVYLLPYAL